MNFINCRVNLEFCKRDWRNRTCTINGIFFCHNFTQEIVKVWSCKSHCDFYGICHLKQSFTEILLFLIFSCIFKWIYVKTRNLLLLLYFIYFFTIYGTCTINGVFFCYNFTQEIVKVWNCKLHCDFYGICHLKQSFTEILLFLIFSCIFK